MWWYALIPAPDLIYRRSSISPRPHCMHTDQAINLRAPSECVKRPVYSCVSRGGAHCSRRSKRS